MDYKKSSKTRQIFNCIKCDYKCSKQSDYNKHLLTLKHQKETSELQMDYNLSHTINFICGCGNEYKHRQGLWKHKKKCCEKMSQKISNNEPQNSEIKLLTNLVLDVVKQNKELTQQNSELTNKIVDICKIGQTNNSISNSNINSHNNIIFRIIII